MLRQIGDVLSSFINAENEESNRQLFVTLCSIGAYFSSHAHCKRTNKHNKGLEFTPVLLGLLALSEKPVHTSNVHGMDTWSEHVGGGDGSRLGDDHGAGEGADEF